MRIRNRSTRTLLCALACTSLALVGCDDDDDDDGGGSGNDAGAAQESGGRIGSNFFGGGSSGGDNEGGPDGDGGGEPGGEGGIPGQDNTGNGGGASAAACQAACVGIVGCLNTVCMLGLDGAAVQEAINGCVPECQAEAGADELAQITMLLQGGCGQFETLAQEEGICEDFDADDFEDPEPPPGGGGNPGGGGDVSAGDCQAFCQRAVACAGEAGDELPIDSCVQACGSGVFPAAGVQCALAQGGASCQAIEAECGAQLQPDIEESCDVDTFCSAVRCAQGCGQDQSCIQECASECIPSGCACDESVAQQCF